MVNRTINPHRGGVPRGYSWTAEAEYKMSNLRFHNDDRHGPLRDCPLCRMDMRSAATIIRDHSRRESTRSEAKRLLAILEART